MRNLKSIILLLIAGLVASTVAAQTLTWNPSTTLIDGRPIPPDEVVKYRVFVGPDVDSLTERAELVLTRITFEDMAVDKDDRWVAVEASTDTRLSSRSEPLKLIPINVKFRLSVEYTLP